MTLQVIPLDKNNINSILPIENESFVIPWSYDNYLAELTSNPYAYYFMLVSKETKEVLGFMGFYIMFEQAQISKIAIAKKYRGLKLSKLLMLEAIKRITLASCENITLEVRVSNVIAINLYQSMGFKTINVRKKYYQDGEDAYLMIKYLKEKDE